MKPKKSLGQNFINDTNLLSKIVDDGKISTNDTILEIGPGTGSLTNEILKKKPKKLIVVEKDNNLSKFLFNKFGDQIKILNKDILTCYKDFNYDEPIKVFGNLPYNISTEILCKWILNLKEKIWFDYLILMFQKEVADRIISDFNTKSYGRLTILANWRLNIKKICDVSPVSFQPKPKIYSTVLFFEPKKEFFSLKNSKNLEKITRTFFMHRRKMIKKPYYQLFNNDNTIASKVGIDLNLRPQNLDFETYFKLTKEYEDLRS